MGKHLRTATTSVPVRVQPIVITLQTVLVVNTYHTGVYHSATLVTSNLVRSEPGSIPALSAHVAGGTLLAVGQAVLAGHARRFVS